MNLCAKSKCLRLNLVSSLYRLSSTAPTEVPDTNDQVIIDDTDDARAREEEIEKKRNISRLSAAHYNFINGRRPYDEPRSVTHLTVKYNRKMYGNYGSASGVNPSLCWPSKKDIQEKLEYEKVAFPYTIQEMMATVEQKNKENYEKMLQRDIDVAAKFEKLAMWRKEVDDKLAKKTKEADAAKAKKERLVEEVRRHFGFKLDPRDERFKEMLAKKEKEQKKQEKMAKRDAKEKMMIAKLQQKNVQIKEGNIVNK